MPGSPFWKPTAARRLLRIDDWTLKDPAGGPVPLTHELLPPLFIPLLRSLSFTDSPAGPLDLIALILREETVEPPVLRPVVLAVAPLCAGARQSAHGGAPHHLRQALRGEVTPRERSGGVVHVRRVGQAGRVVGASIKVAKITLGISVEENLFPHFRHWIVEGDYRLRRISMGSLHEIGFRIGTVRAVIGIVGHSRYQGELEAALLRGIPETPQ